MLAISLLLNCLIVFPVSFGMLAGSAGMTAAFGPPGDARQILASVYLAIGLLSAMGLVALLAGYGEVIRPIAVGLLAMQVVYKVITVATVGLASPVVLTNLAVIAVHGVTLVTLLRN